jgi:hypothetical protein
MDVRLGVCVHLCPEIQIQVQMYERHTICIAYMHTHAHARTRTDAHTRAHTYVCDSETLRRWKMCVCVCVQVSAHTHPHTRLYIYHLSIKTKRYVYIFSEVDMDGRRGARGSPRLVERLRALPCARQSRSLAAQLAALDSRYWAPSAGGTVPLACLPTSALVPAQRGLSVIM